MSKPMLSKVIAHAREREYMGGIDRDKLRVKATGEVFTPTPLVQEILDRIPVENFENPYKTFLDNSCGDGQFLSEVLIRKLEVLCNHRDWVVKSRESIGQPVPKEEQAKWFEEDFKQALSTIYGVDLMEDNVKLCRERLLCGFAHFSHIVEKNIVCHDALTYDYSFNGTNFTDAELRDQKLGFNAMPKKEKKVKAKKEETQYANTGLFE